jgi:hypothetical protein
VKLFRRREQDPDGPLPADGTVTIAGVELTGKRMRADLEGRGPEVLWRTVGKPPAGAWARLADAFGQTGLWPLMIIDERLDLGYLDPQWPQHVTVDLAEALPKRWAEFGAYDEELREQMGAFPGLAAPGPEPAEDPAEQVFAALEIDSLALVPVQRPADALAAIGWMGAVNSFTPVELVPYLRSWEERFDARVVALGFDTVHVAVARPPAETDKAAAEVYMFCPDIVHQGIGSVEELAATMIPSPYWYFWWD